MKKGFTLIELLAVLIVLGLILSITIPTVVNMMIKAKKDTLNLSTERIEYAVNAYLEEYAIKNNGGSTGNFKINISNNKVENNTIVIKGKIPKSGVIDIRSNGNIYLVLYNDGFCSYKGPNDTSPKIEKMDEEDCKLSLVDDKKIFVENSLNSIEVGQSYNLLDGVSFKDLGGTVISNEITYTSSPEFNNNISGTYNITYSTTYEGTSYTATKIVTVKEIEYTINYILNGGTATNYNSYNIKSEKITLSSPEKDGYEFSGWSGTGLTGIVESVEIPTGSTGTREYEAHYTPLIYLLTCYLNNGADPILSSYTIETDTFTLENPTLSGSEFAGWSLSPSGDERLKPVSIVKGTTGNKTFYANYENRTFTLTVNVDGGSWSGTTSQPILAGTSVTIPYPTKADHVFGGWTKTGVGSTINGTTFTMGSGDASLTAIWYSYSAMFTYTGTTLPVINDGSGNWRIKFITDGTFTPLVDMIIDVFLVGGGGGSNGTHPGGGGGGYTTTQKTITLSANTPYTIVVGLGGSPGINGGASSAFGYTANGGNKSTTYNGGAGGSGGGCGAHSDGCGGGSGGSNGSNGGSNCGSGGTGQGTSIGTREFGEASGTLYSGGGGGNGTCCFDGAGGAGGGGAAWANGTTNTGGGGGAFRSGGSGIVVIRNHR